MRYKGFTLAEVLITLGVIGVVAAMTLPTLIQEHREKARVTQVKKAYSILSQAFTMAVQEYGDIEDWELTTTSTGKTDEDGNAVYETSGQILLRNRLAQYVKQLDRPNKLEFRSFKALDGRYFKSDTYTSFDTDTGFFLADGTYVNVGWVNLGCSNSIVACGDLFVFLPPQRDAKMGVNWFNFYVSPTGIQPMGAEKDTRKSFEKYCDIKNSEGLGSMEQGRACTAWVIYNGNMDYLHCNDLSWHGKTKCK